jgi:hypothetical protein
MAAAWTSDRRCWGAIQIMVTIATFGEPLEANLAKGYLESAGIPAFLADEQTVGIAWHLTNAIGGIKLQVADDRADEAQSILAERSSTKPDAPEPLDITDTTDAPDATIPDPSPTLSYEAAGTEDEQGLEPTNRERNADRAWRGALFGLLFFPLELYVFWLLIKVFTSDERVNPRQLRRALMAAVINVPAVLLILFICKEWLI